MWIHKSQHVALYFNIAAMKFRGHFTFCFKLFCFSACPEVLTAVGGYPGTGMSVVHPQLFLPLPTRSTLYKVTAAAPTHTLIPNVNVIYFFHI